MYGDNQLYIFNLKQITEDNIHYAIFLVEIRSKGHREETLQCLIDVSS